MHQILVGSAIYALALVNPPVIEDSIVSAPVPIERVVCWGCYRSPYRTYYPPPGYRTPYWGIPRQGYWGPRWKRDPNWRYNRALHGGW